MNIKQNIGKIFHKIMGNDLSSLVRQGLIIGQNVFIGSDVVLDPSAPWLISIGDDCTITSRVVILTHDGSMKRHIGYSKFGSVSIGRKTFIGMGSIILPGVIIGENVIIGAGSVVTKNIPDNSVAFGNPAKTIESTSDFIKRHTTNMETLPVFNHDWTLKAGITEYEKKIMKEALQDKIGYDL